MGHKVSNGKIRKSNFAQVMVICEIVSVFALDSKVRLFLRTHDYKSVTEAAFF